MTAIPSDILDDICSRFLVNLPEEERSDPIRICFQIEYAHWFYIDFYCKTQENCSKCGFRDFIRVIFHHCDFLKPFRNRVDWIVDEWRKYKANVPTYGAILLDASLTYVLLVQGFYAKNSWGFPKGKVNEDESPLNCAVREVYEEVGFDAKHLASETAFLEWRQSKDTYPVRMYIAPGVPLDFQFQPKTRNEIRKIQWFRIDELPESRNSYSESFALQPSQVYNVLPFVEGLRNWISQKTGVPPRKTPSRQRKTSSPASAFTPVHKSGSSSKLLASGKKSSPVPKISSCPEKSLEELLGLRFTSSTQSHSAATPPPGVVTDRPIYEAVITAEDMEPHSSKPRTRTHSHKEKKTGLKIVDARPAKAWTNVKLDVEALLAAWS